MQKQFLNHEGWKLQSPKYLYAGLDAVWLKGYLQKYPLHRIKIQELPDELEISPSEVREALYNNPSIDTEKILKNMADEVEPWQKKSSEGKILKKDTT